VLALRRAKRHGSSRACGLPLVLLASCLCICATSAWAQPAQDLIAHYSLDGNATDGSGHGRDAVVFNAVPSTDRFGVAARAYRFNGVNSSIEAASLPALTGDFSVSYWAKSTQSRRMHALSLGTSTSDNLDFDVNDGPFGLFVYWKSSGGNATWTTPSGSVTDGTWHHITLLRRGTQLELYVDGAVRGSRTYAGTMGGPGPLRMGRGSYAPLWWDGWLDDVRVYSRALNESEIDTLSDDRPVATLTAPGGGEQWTAGQVHNITWTAEPHVTSVALDYSLDAGTTWQLITASVAAGTGQYAWTVPAVSSRDALVRVRAGTASSQSPSVFSILTLTDDLAAYYPFTGNANDASGHELHGVVNSATLVPDRFGVPARAYQFNGVSSSIEVASLPALTGDFSVSYWAKSTRTYRMHALSLGTSASDNLDFAFNNSPQGLLAYWNSSGAHSVASTGLASGSLTNATWHHITLLRRSGQVELYIDGTLRGSRAYAGTVGGPGPLRMGRGSYATLWWDGWLDDVRVYSRVLNESEIDTLSDDRPAATLTAPSGGEQWIAGRVHDITWTAEPHVTTVALDYSLDNGATWQAITASVAAATGQYAWTVPAVSSRQALVRVRAGTASSQSPNVFSILQLTDDLVAYYPFTGNADDASGHGLHGVVGTATLTADRFGVAGRAYRFNGVNSSIEVASLPALTGDFSVSYWAKSTQSRRMHALSLGTNGSDNLDFDVNDGPFGLFVYWNGSGGNATWMTPSGSVTDGAWHHITLLRRGVQVELHVDGTLRRSTTYAGTVGGPGPLRMGRGSYAPLWWDGWLDDVRIYSRALDAVEVGTLSDDRISVTLIAPRGGEQWTAGQVHTITWTAEPNVTTVALDYSLNNGATWQTIASSVAAGTGQYAWTVPAVSSRDTLVRVRAGTWTSQSLSVFSIFQLTDDLVAYYPFTGNANDASGHGFHGVVDSATLVPDRFGVPGRAYRFNGVSSSIEVVNLPALTGDFSVSYWAKSAQTYRMHALSFGTSAADNLDFNFNDDNSALMTYWNAGQTGTAFIQSARGDGSFTNGAWHHVVLMRRGSRIDLFVDGELQGWKQDLRALVASPLRVGRGSYADLWWDGDVDDIRVYYRALTEIEVATLSDDRPAITLLSPIGGERWAAGSAHEVTWMVEPQVSAVALDYSLDNGATWQEIAASIPAATGRYTWTLPNVAPTLALVRARDAAQPSTLSRAVDLVITDSSGELWRLVTSSAQFGPRDGMGPVVFKDRMWLLGGWHHTDPSTASEIWSSYDGQSWELVGRGPWTSTHACGCVVFNDKMWVISGDARPTVYFSDDGIQWTLATDSAPWGGRYKPYVVVFDGKIWLMGGLAILDEYRPYNDVWSSDDGINWTLVTEHAPWEPRGIVHGSVVFAGKMWILGGGLYGPPPSWRPEVYYNDIWTSVNGIDWTRVTAEPSWLPRIHHSVSVYADRMWVLAGHDSDGLKNDVWVSGDGIDWRELPDTPWVARHAASTLVHRNTLWLVAGYLVNDIWKLNLSGNVTINSGALAASNRVVDLTLLAPRPGSARMQLSNDGVVWSQFESYRRNVSWTLADGVGSKRVHVRFSDASGSWTETFVDEIAYSPSSYVRLMAPAGGEEWRAGTTYNVTWEAGESVANVKLEASYDGGASWSVITASAPASVGRYAWTVPDVASTQCLVRITDVAGGPHSQSPGAFTLFKAPAGLIASYLFEGNAEDTSGNQNHGVVLGAALGTDRFGRQAAAYSFTGDGGHIEILNIPTVLAGDFTVAFWAKSSQTQRMHAMGLGNNDENNLDFDFNDGTYGLAAYWNSAGQNNLVTPPPSAAQFTNGNWHHVVLRRIGSQIELLVDGTLRGVTTYWGAIGDRGFLRIGRGSYLAFPWVGSVDDVLIFIRALTDQEVVALSNDRP